MTLILNVTSGEVTSETREYVVHGIPVFSIPKNSEGKTKVWKGVIRKFIEDSNTPNMV